MNVHALLIDHASTHPSKPAIIYKDQTITYSELKQHVQRTIFFLQSQGLGRGDKVAIFFPNTPEYIYSYIALFSLGAVVVPLDFMLTEAEIIGFLSHSDAVAMVAHTKKGIDFHHIRKACPLLKTVLMKSEDPSPVNAPGVISWADGQRETGQHSFQENYCEQDPAAIFYTSGSTGHPKGVLLTYAHWDCPVRCIETFLQPTGQDVYLCAGVPFSHIGGLDYILFTLHYGSTLVLMDRFQPLETLKNLEKYKITIFCIVPSMYIAIVSVKETQRFDLSTLRYAVVFGAPSSPELLQRFHQLCPKAKLLNGWGMTETAAPNTISPPDISKLTSIGPFGVDMEARIVDEEGRDVGAGERGELWVKGKAVMAGYYKEDGLTREVMTADGWLKTGDIARQDPDGLYYLAGRKKEMIKVAGEIVFAPEVESVILRHPKVEEVAVIGVSDQLRGEVPKAFIVPKKDQAITTDEVRQFCRDILAHFKLPHIIEFRQALPKNRIGKIDKEQLKREHSSV